MGQKYEQPEWKQEDMKINSKKIWKIGSQKCSNMTEERQIEDHLPVYNIGSFENYKEFKCYPIITFLSHHSSLPF